MRLLIVVGLLIAVTTATATTYAHDREWESETPHGVDVVCAAVANVDGHRYTYTNYVDAETMMEDVERYYSVTHPDLQVNDEQVHIKCMNIPLTPK